MAALAELHFITRDGQNVVASFCTSTFWLLPWQHVFEISYTYRYYLDERTAVWACRNSFWFGNYVLSKFADFTRRISLLSFFNKTLVCDFSYFLSLVRSLLNLAPSFFIRFYRGVFKFLNLLAEFLTFEILRDWAPFRVEVHFCTRLHTFSVPRYSSYFAYSFLIRFYMGDFHIKSDYLFF